VRLAAHLERTTPRVVGVDDPLAAHDRATRGEVRPLDDRGEVLDRGFGVVDQQDRAVDDLAEVVRRDVGGHADRDPGAAVDEQVRVPRRQDARLGGGLVVVRDHVDGLFVEVP
jgi:hypothetical protein